MITKKECRTIEETLQALKPEERRRATVWYQSALSAVSTIQRECPWLAAMVSIAKTKPVCHINILELKPLALTGGITKTVTETAGYLQIDLTAKFQVPDRPLEDNEDPEDCYSQAEDLLDFTNDIINTYANV